MIDKIGHIKNPLTVIAMFAGIAEVSGSVILPFITPENQKLYIYFLISFPTLLIGLFFITLWKKHHALYAPSDFQDEKNFRELIRPATQTEIDEKIKKEKLELTESDAANNLQISKNDNKYDFRKYEQYAFKKLTEIFGDYFDLETTLICGEQKITVDGIFFIKNVWVITEVIHAANFSKIPRLIDRTISMMQVIDKEWAQATVEMQFAIVLVTPLRHDSYEKIKTIMEASSKRYNLNIKLMIYNAQDLEDEFKNVKIELKPIR